MEAFSGYVQVLDEEEKAEQEVTVTNCSDTWNWYPSGRRQGWQCPVCGRVYAPWVSQCQHCSGWGYPWRYPYTTPYWTGGAGGGFGGGAGTVTVSGDYQVMYNGQTGGA